MTLLEAGADVGAGTSKANTALLHTGFDAKPGTLEARLVARGYELLSAYAERVGIPVERTGALLVAWDEEQHARFPRDRRASAGERARRPARARLRGAVPARAQAGSGALGALEVAGESIICPFTTLAFATEAVLAGCELRRSSPVHAIERLDQGGFGLSLPVGSLTAGWVEVNRACADEIDRMLGQENHDRAAARRADRLRQAARPLCGRSCWLCRPRSRRAC